MTGLVGMTDNYRSVKSLLASLEITCSMEVTLRLLAGPHLSLELGHVGHLEELLGPVLGGDGLDTDQGQQGAIRFNNLYPTIPPQKLNLDLLS